MSPIAGILVLFAGLTCALADLATQVSIEEFPYLVQVENRVGPVWLQHCVGSVLTNYHILSAASCFTDYATTTNSRIRAGANYRGIDGVVKEIYSISNHPTYGLLGDDGDISVLRLQSSLTFSSTIRQVAIFGDGIYLPENSEVTLLGWGATAEGGIEGNNYLYSLELTTTNEEECLIKYISDRIVTENMVCAGLYDTKGRNFDYTDVGAPLIFQNIVAGIVSFGVPSTDDEYPIVSAAVGSYSDWIIATAV